MVTQVWMLKESEHESVRWDFSCGYFLFCFLVNGFALLKYVYTLFLNMIYTYFCLQFYICIT